jgi:hypothetical protein
LGPRSWLRPFPLSPRRVLGFPKRDSRRPIESFASREHVASDTPCRAPPFPRQRRVHREEPELFPPATHQRGWLPKLEAPSSDRSLPPHPSPKLGMRLSDRHWYLSFAASAQLPPCVHAWLSRARPTPPRLLPRFGLSHMLPIEFCSRKDPRAHLRKYQTPAALMTSKLASTGWRYPLRGHTN